MASLDYLGQKLYAMGLLVFGRKAAAMAVFDGMERRWPADRYVLASRAHLLSQLGRTDEALAASARLIESAGNDAPAWFNHGFMLEAAGRYEEALAAFGRATTLDPKLDRAWYGLGLVLIRLERFDEAVEALKRNTELQPMSPYGWYQLARVHVDRQQPEEARKIIRHLKGFEPKVAAQLERETGLVAAEPAG
ncbi:MAG: tetratricopeptide repeat protein [Betaproteobacteria bacterium]|nr:tetratricopeptide repeat protein [Betaproteobacteria bacterium]MCC6250196.1 tetratricopeptide repeat protein [Rubrivivax sp.]MCL4699826.1 tetratricopeptide repeat protein [Burkholderiaceae bacterium]